MGNCNALCCLSDNRVDPKSDIITGPIVSLIVSSKANADLRKGAAMSRTGNDDSNNKSPYDNQDVSPYSNMKDR